MSPASRALDLQGNLTDQPAVTTVVFTAHNRRDLVLEAIALALKQTVPIHIIVGDDASSDGTEEAVRAAFPDVTYLRSEVSRGPCYQRNRGLELAVTEIVFPLDDDSMLVDPRTLEVALGDFAQPDVGIVCMPFNNVLQDTRVRHFPRPDMTGLLFDFAACAHGLRREAALAVGGFNEDLFYTQEEGDLALRMYEHGGWRTINGTSPVLHHMQVPGKISYIQEYTTARNKILVYYRYAPLRHMFVRIAGSVVTSVLNGLKRRRPKAWISGVRDGLGLVLSGKAKRTPVRPDIFSAYIRQR
jgi:glycosyltransferase involved in cell wall biosynthesis